MQFNWRGAIELNRNALLRILATLFSMADMADGAIPETLPRHRLNAVRRILKTAESALRRLIVIAARDIADIPWPVGVHAYGLGPHPAGRGTAKRSGNGDDAAAPIPPFPLSDPVRTFSLSPPRRRSKASPRITFLGPGAPPPRPVPDGWYCLPDDECDAGPVCRRLIAAKRALDDLDGAAERLARLQQRRDRAMAGGPDRRSPLRLGKPPGHRRRPRHEADAVLAELHLLAGWTMSPDTS